MLNKADITPVYKKNDRLEIGNYRPVSILLCLSKISECMFIDQLWVLFEKFASPRLSGFRKHYSRQNVLTSVVTVEKAKKSLDNKQVYGALLTDLSKAFDCLPYRLLISNLHAYGLSMHSCKLIASYFTQRQQRVRIGNCKSSWLTVKKGKNHDQLWGYFFLTSL